MRILQRHLVRGLMRTSLLALFVLVALFSFFSLIDQLEEAGRGGYGVFQAVTYVLLTVPRIATELFPVAAVIGAMALLGLLARDGELAVIRTSGVSAYRLAMMMAGAGAVLAVIAVLLGEVAAPAGEERAQYLKTVSLTRQISLKSRYGFWARDGDSYVNIRKVLPGDRMEDIYIYEFDGTKRLRTSTHARRAVYEGDRWRLEDLEQTLLDGERMRSRSVKAAAWDSFMDPEMINLVIVTPRYLSLWGLVQYIGFLRENRQNTQAYEQALWLKLVRPFSILCMVVLAVPLVAGRARGLSVGRQVLLGALIGVVFHLLNEAAANAGVVYGIPPAVCAAAPTLGLALIITLLLRRAQKGLEVI